MRRCPAGRTVGAGRPRGGQPCRRDATTHAPPARALKLAVGRPADLRGGARPADRQPGRCRPRAPPCGAADGRPDVCRSARRHLAARGRLGRLRRAAVRPVPVGAHAVAGLHLAARRQPGPRQRAAGRSRRARARPVHVRGDLLGPTAGWRLSRLWPLRWPRCRMPARAAASSPRTAGWCPAPRSTAAAAARVRCRTWRASAGRYRPRAAGCAADLGRAAAGARAGMPLVGTRSAPRAAAAERPWRAARGGAWCRTRRIRAGAGGRYDLLESGPDDRHFVVEIDDDGAAHLRFGDGVLGRQPQAGDFFRAASRIGNGRAGNVGRDSIVWLALKSGGLSADLQPRNPLPASRRHRGGERWPR